MGFVVFDPTTPYDARTLVDETPTDHHVRGMMFNRVQRALRETARRVPFKFYPLRDYNALVVRAAESLYPNSPIGLGLWNVGAFAVKAFGESMAGRTFFTLADGDLMRGLHRLPKAYDLIQDHGQVEIIEASEETLIVRLREIWRPVPFHVGLLECALGLFRWSGTFSVREEKLGTVAVRASSLRPMGSSPFGS